MSIDRSIRVIKPWINRLDKTVPEILPKEKNTVAISQELAVNQVLFQDLRLHIDPEVFTNYNKLRWRHLAYKLL